MGDRPSLLLGLMELNDPDGDAYGTEVHVEGTSKGTARPITETIASFLEQGAIEVTQGWETREVPLRVTFETDDLVDGLAAAEIALISELNKPNELVWTPYHPDLPGDHYGTPIVFEVINSWLEPVEYDGNREDDQDEYATRPAATYQIRLVCRSFVYSATTTTVPAVTTSPSASLTQVTDASSATGWTGTVDGVAETPTLVSGTVQIAMTPDPHDISGHTMTLQLPASLMPVASGAGTSDWYVTVDYYRVGSGNVQHTYLYDPAWAETDLAPIAEYATGTSGQLRAVFLIDGTTASSLANVVFEQRQGPKSLTGDPGDLGFRIDAVYRSTTAPNPGGERELLRSFVANGSAPALGSLSIQHDTAALGEVLVYTCAGNNVSYNPAGRPYRNSGGTVTTPDTAAVSGSSEPLSDNPTFHYPAVSLDDGEYLLFARVRTTTLGADATDITWTITPLLNGTVLADPDVHTTAIETNDSSFHLHRLGMVHLPPITMPATDAVIKVDLDTPDTTWILDNIYLFNMSTGQLTWVNCGSGAGAVGGSSRRLFIDAPSIANDGRGDLLRGHSADRSDAFSAYPDAYEEGRHRFDPRSPVTVFSIADGPSTAAPASFTYRAAGLTRLLADW